MPTMNVRDWVVAVLVILILRAAGFINNAWFFIGILAFVGMLVLLQQNIPDGARIPVITVYLALIVVWLVSFLGTRYMPLTTDATNKQRILRDIMESERMNPAALVGLDALRQYCNAEEQVLIREVTGQMRAALGLAASTAKAPKENEFKKHVAAIREGNFPEHELQTKERFRMEVWLRYIGELRASCSKFILDYYKENKLGTPTKFNPWAYLWMLPAIAVVGFFAGWWLQEFWVFKYALGSMLIGILLIGGFWSYMQLFDDSELATLFESLRAHRGMLGIVGVMVITMIIAKITNSSQTSNILAFLALYVAYVIGVSWYSGGEMSKSLGALSAKGVMMGIMGILTITRVVDQIIKPSPAAKNPLSTLVMFVGFMIVMTVLLNYFFDVTGLYDGLDALLKWAAGGMKSTTVKP